MGGWIATARFSSPGSLPRPGGGGGGLVGMLFWCIFHEHIRGSFEHNILRGNYIVSLG